MPRASFAMAVLKAISTMLNGGKQYVIPFHAEAKALPAEPSQSRNEKNLVHLLLDLDANTSIEKLVPYLATACESKFSNISCRSDKSPRCDATSFLLLLYRYRYLLKILG